MSAFDRRLTPAREDVAAAHLQGIVASKSYVAGVLHQVVRGQCNLHAAPVAHEGLETQLHHGELFHVYEQREGWAWGQTARDGYVGYVARDALSADVVETTHRVTALKTLVYPGPSMKLTPQDLLCMNAEIAVEGLVKGFAKTRSGYVWAAHLCPKDQYTDDFVEVARRFENVPYLWGGRSSLGIDCSGLVQEAFLATGQAVLRDTDMQEGSIGAVRSEGGVPPTLARGDLVFWRRHVGIMIDGRHVLHANAHHMSVAVEPLSEAMRRIKSVEGPVTSVRRPA